MRIKKREITITILVALICVAGYVNWNYQRQQAQPVAVPEATQPEQSAQEEGAGDAAAAAEGQRASDVADGAEKDADRAAAPEGTSAPEGTGTPEESGSGYFSEDKINKEKAKSESIALLNQIISNESATEEAKNRAQEEVLFLSKSVEMEQRAETLLKAKGYAETNVLISADVVNVIVKTEGLDASDVTKIRDIASEVSGLGYDAVKIIEVKK